MARPRDPRLADAQATNVRLPRDLHDAARARALEEDRTLSQLIRVALKRYLSQPTGE
jgi:predicted HicB family RNase H-like nuclease